MRDASEKQTNKLQGLQKVPCTLSSAYLISHKEDKTLTLFLAYELCFGLEIWHYTEIGKIILPPSKKKGS